MDAEEWPYLGALREVNLIGLGDGRIGCAGAEGGAEAGLWSLACRTGWLAVPFLHRDKAPGEGPGVGGKVEGLVSTVC